MKKILVLLILSITLIFTTVTPAFAETSYEVYHGKLNFDDFKYEHYTLDEMNNLSNKLKSLVKQSGKIDDIWDCIEDMLFEIDYIQSLYVYTQIQISIDHTNSYYKSEQEYCSELIADAENIYGLAIKDALKSSYKEQLIEDNYFQLSSYENYVPNSGGTSTALTQYMMQYYDLYDDISNIENLSDSDYKKLQDKAADIYSNIISTYKKNYVSYNEFMKSYWDRDFSTEEIAKLRSYVKKYIVPLYVQMYNDGAEDNYSLYTKNVSTSYILDSIGMYIGNISSDMKTAFQYMRNLNLYYIDNDKNNVDEGYTVEFYYLNEPYIYLYKSNTFYDFSSLIHEFGHFYHAYNDDNYYLLIPDDIDAAEVHSQALELLFLDYYDEIFGNDADSLRKTILCDMLGSIVQGCCVDEFEETVFNSSKKMSGEDLTKLCEELCEEYGLDEIGFPGYYWISIPHLYQSPGYYIGYAISALISFDIWENSLTDKEKAVEQYFDFEYYSDYSYLKDIMDEVGIRDIFSESYVQGLETTVQNYLGNPISDTTTKPDNTEAEMPTNSHFNMNTESIVFIMIFVVSLGIVVVVGLVLMKKSR